MRMHGVSGAITFARDQVFADVQGRVENLPYHVKLRYEGTDANAPFTCEVVSNDFQVERNPRLLLFAPPVVKYRLATFSSPTAIVNTRLTITRGRPVNSSSARPGARTTPRRGSSCARARSTSRASWRCGMGSRRTRAFPTSFRT